MFSYIWRFIKRFAVLIPGIVIAYFSVRDIYPWLDESLVTPIAILITYILGAYVLIPALIRLLRIVFPAKHLPLYTVTPDGFASDPINIAVIGTRRELIRAMRKAGWHVASKKSVQNMLRIFVSTVLNREYFGAPMSNLYLFGRKQDIGFEVPIKGARNHRHHVRFWATTYESEKASIKSIQWLHQEYEAMDSKKMIWIGAASRDAGLTVIRHNGQMTHLIDPDTNAERAFIIKSLRDRDQIATVSIQKLGNPYGLINRGWRGKLHTDGKLHILKLRTPKTNKSRP